MDPGGATIYWINNVKSIIYYGKHKISVKVAKEGRKCHIKNNKNSKNNKKSSKKTRAELQKMKVETANEVGYSKNQEN